MNQLIEIIKYCENNELHYEITTSYDRLCIEVEYSFYIFVDDNMRCTLHYEGLVISDVSLKHCMLQITSIYL